MDHMACEGLLENLPHMLRETSANEAARNEVVEVLHRVATAMERAAELLRTHLTVPALFVSSPGILYWGGMFQQFVYMLTEICLATLNSICVRLTCTSGKLTSSLLQSQYMHTWQQYYACCNLWNVVVMPN